MLHKTTPKIYLIQQNNTIYFCSSNLLSAYRFLIDNINPLDRKLVKSYKQYTLDFKKSPTLLIPSNCGQMFQIKRMDLFSKYNSITSNSKLLKTT